MNPANCQCKYCGKKKSQREITQSMGESGILPVSPTSSPGPSARRVQPRKLDSQPQRASNLRQPAVFASVQKKPKVKQPSSNLVSGATMVVERDSDVRAVYAQTGMKLKRWLREDEVVWCALRTPIPGPEGQQDSIRFWPGVIDETRVKSESFPLPGSASSSNHPYNPDEPPWTVKQYTVYKVKLLATKVNLHLPDDQVLPYLAYLPSPELIHALQNISPDHMKYDEEYTSTFNPCPDSSEFLPAFIDAAGPLAFAIEIASTLAHYWGLSDEWQYEYTVPGPSNRPSASSRNLTLAEALAVASSSNARDAAAKASYESYNTTISTNRPGIPLEQIAPKTIGPPPYAGQSFQRTQFQGMWWGCERIWVNDFVRLKLTRKAIAPTGAPRILPPAGPGRQFARICQEEGRDLSEAGAATRGSFMRLDDLFVVETITDKGKKRECRASGMLYELVDEDWEEESSSSGGTNNDASGPSNRSQARLPHASPFKPSALPNPDPTVPIDNTSSRTNASPLSSPPKPPSAAGSGAQTSAEWRPPQAPKGFRFRPILEDGFEAVFSLAMISGRYYPGITEHPILDQYYHDSIKDLREGKLEYSVYSHLWTLEGLLPGASLAMDPVNYKKDRTKMLEDAHQSAMEDLDVHLAEKRQRDADDENDMDVDVIGNHAKMEVDEN